MNTVGQAKVLTLAFADISARVGLIVMLTLLVLTPVFKNMPQNAQAAIIISAGLPSSPSFSSLHLFNFSFTFSFLQLLAFSTIRSGSTCGR